MDWESDPELKKLREDFIASLQERCSILRQAIRDISHESAEAASEAAEFTETPQSRIRVLTHKVAGVAGSYGFDTLSRIGAALEEWMVLTHLENVEEFLSYTRLLEEALTWSIEHQNDPAHLLEDPRWQTLSSGLESISA